MRNNLSKEKLIVNIMLVPTAIFVATALMIFLYTLPTTKIKENISRSSSMYDGSSYSVNNWANGKKYTGLSNFTDSIMLNTAVYRPKTSVIENAMISAHATYSEQEDVTDLLRYVQEEKGYITKEYTRYWHGYLLYIIPSLQFMDVGELKVIGMFLQFFLTMMLIHLLGKKSSILMFLYGVIALFINPVTTVLTFQEADIYCIMIISMIIILQYNDKLKNGWYFSFFMINGIIVSFFDFLTYPLVAFGVPLILVLLLDRFNEITIGIKKIFAYGTGWVIGYGGMWSGKWAIGSILTGRNLFSDAVLSIRIRTHGQGEFNGEMSYKNTIQTIWNSIDDLPMFILLILIIGFIVTCFISGRYRFSLGTIELKRCLCFSVVGLFPFVWFFVVMNHSVIHPWMSYRELAITLWAIVAIIYTILTPQTDYNNV